MKYCDCKGNIILVLGYVPKYCNCNENLIKVLESNGILQLQQTQYLCFGINHEILKLQWKLNVSVRIYHEMLELKWKLFFLVKSDEIKELQRELYFNV